MSRSARIFRFIRPRIPGTVLCKRLLVITPTEHILRGFLLDPTSTKNLVQPYRLVMPLYLPGNFLSLNYASRLQWIMVDPDNYAASADDVYDLIKDHVDELRAIRHPVDFLKFSLAGGGYRTIWRNFDLALTHYLAGNDQDVLRNLRAFEAEVAALPPSWQVERRSVLDRVLHELDTNPLGLMPLLQEWEDAKVEALGLQPSRIALAS